MSSHGVLPPNRIAFFREAAHMARVDLASRLGVGEATISRWEKGQTPNIPDRHKLAMAELFGVSVPFLMGWENANGNGQTDNDVDGNGAEKAA